MTPFRLHSIICCLKIKILKDSYFYTPQRKVKLHHIASTAVLVLRTDFYFSHMNLLTAAVANSYIYL